MNRNVLYLGLAALSILLAGASEPAGATSRWFAAVDFEVGDVDFSLGFSDIDDHYRHPRYYYRTGARLSHRGFECHSSCYVRDDRYYHHPECPLVLRHFDRHRFDPYPAWTALPDGGVRFYPRHRGPDYDDDHRGRRRGGRRGGSHDWYDDDSDYADSDSDSRFDH